MIKRFEVIEASFDEIRDAAQAGDMEKVLLAEQKGRVTLLAFREEANTDPNVPFT